MEQSIPSQLAVRSYKSRINLYNSISPLTSILKAASSSFAIIIGVTVTTRTAVQKSVTITTARQQETFLEARILDEPPLSSSSFLALGSDTSLSEEDEDDDECTESSIVIMMERDECASLSCCESQEKRGLAEYVIATKPVG